MEDRGVYLVIGFTDEGSSFQYTQKRAEDVEKRLIPLLDKENSPYNRFLMIVPGFGSENSFLIISLLDNWKNRKQSSQTIMRQAIGKIVTVPQTLSFSYIASIYKSFKLQQACSNGYLWKYLRRARTNSNSSY